MTVTYKEIIDLNFELNKLTTKEVQVAAVLKALDAKDEVSEYVSKYQQAFKQIMADFNVTETKGVFNWSEHPQIEIISDKVTELLKTEVELEKVKVFELNEVLALTAGATIGEITYFRKYLKK
jgi:hypothetical protein